VFDEPEDRSCCRNKTGVMYFSHPIICTVSAGVRLYRIFEHANEIHKTRLIMSDGDY
jgi:hypothetical protein